MRFLRKRREYRTRNSNVDPVTGHEIPTTHSISRKLSYAALTGWGFKESVTAAYWTSGVWLFCMRRRNIHWKEYLKALFNNAST